MRCAGFGAVGHDGQSGVGGERQGFVAEGEFADDGERMAAGTVAILRAPKPDATPTTRA